MVGELERRVKFGECQSKALQITNDALGKKLKNAKELSAKIKKFTEMPSFMTKKAIEAERKKLKESMEFSSDICLKIEELKKKPEYLNSGQILSLQREIASLKKKKTMERSLKSNFECLICASLPKEVDGNLHIYSCSNHHLLCQGCLPKLKKCPLCEQNFSTQPAKRNPTAERAVAQMAFNEDSDEEYTQSASGKLKLQLKPFCLLISETSDLFLPIAK
jgi:hypothetical protein